MGFKEKLSKETKIDPKNLPSGYQIIGDILLLKLFNIKSYYKKKMIATAVIKLLPYVKTVCEIKEVSGELRQPKIKILHGNKTETLHKEHGILYKLDASKIMFSKGNLNERKRLLPQIKKGEVVVDMFAGIGYFSIPIAKTGKPKILYSIEKNKISYSYLNENIILNRVGRIVPILGDSRKVRIPEKADRILMGYLPETYRFLPAAFGFLKDKGIIHYHDIFSKQELWNKPLEILEEEARKAGFKLEKILEKKIVKDYAPNVYHVVIDAKFQKV